MSILFNINYSSQYTGGGGRLYLYNRGDSCTSVTGGWHNMQYYSSSYNVAWNYGENYLYSNTGSSGHASYFQTNQLANLSGYNTLTILCDNSTQQRFFLTKKYSTSGGLFLNSSTANSLEIDYIVHHYINDEYVLDDGNNSIRPSIHAYEIPNDEYYLGLFIYPNAGQVAHIYEIYLE